jgi:ribosomal protein S18 acetylase RimI-like enzyme
MVTLKMVETQTDLRKFFDFPNKLYKGNQFYVPELRMDEETNLSHKKNPAFEHSEAAQWLAYRDGNIVGRVMALVNHNVNTRWNKKQARFSRLDFIDDQEVSDALIGQAEAWAREKGMDEIVGPMGFCDFDKEGMLVEGFDELSTFATYYNFPYYMQHIERLGYVKEVDWMEYRITVPEKPDEKIARIAELVSKKGGFRLLEFKRSKDALKWGKEIFDLLIDAYKDLYGFVPLTEKQVGKYIDQYFGFVNPAFVKGVVDSNNKLVAIGITLPSLSKALQRNGGFLFPFGFIHMLNAIKKNDTLDMYLVAVKPEYQNSGVNAMLMDAIYRAAAAQGYKYAESNPELEDNEKVRAQWKFFQTRQHRRRRVYIKNLDK